MAGGVKCGIKNTNIMKRIILAMAVVLNCALLLAQTEFDALKYVQTDINGTARYMGMAGAFGALGGDASAIKDNPAGLGIFRKSELSGTLNITMQNTTSNWNDVKSIYENPYKNGLNDLSLIFAIPTSGAGNGIVSSNWSFSYNRLKNFNRNMNIKSGESNSSMTDYMGYFTNGFNIKDLQYKNDINELFDNPNMPTLSVYGYQGYLIDSMATWQSSITNKITPSYILNEKGYQDEYSIGWAGNFSNVFYLGATLNFQSLNYTAIGKYAESFSSEGSMNIGDTIYTKGSGVNLNIGTIIRPNDFLRFGLSIHTPTIYKLTDNYFSTLVYDRKFSSGTIVGPSKNMLYRIQSPMQFNASVAGILGKKGLISLEYVYTNYTGTKLLSNEGDGLYFSDENQGMKDMMNDVATIKIGGEYKITDNFSLRAGFAKSGNATNRDAEKFIRLDTKRVDTEYFIQNSTNYFTAGFGYREASWFLDLAYVNKSLDESFHPYRSDVSYNAVIPASVITKTNNVVVTLGLKF